VGFPVRSFVIGSELLASDFAAVVLGNIECYALGIVTVDE